MKSLVKYLIRNVCNFKETYCFEQKTFHYRSKSDKIHKNKFIKVYVQANENLKKNMD